MRKQTNKYTTMCIYQTLNMSFIFWISNECMKTILWNREKTEPSEEGRERERDEVEGGEKKNEMGKSVTTWL